MYTNAQLIEMKDPQFVFIYNNIKKDMTFHSVLKQSPCYGEGMTRNAFFKMLLMTDVLPVVMAGGDCQVQGEIYKVQPDVFKSLVGFHYGHTPIKVKVTGFKKRVWMWVLPSDNKYILTTLDNPTDLVYNWGSTTVKDTAPKNYRTNDSPPSGRFNEVNKEKPVAVQYANTNTTPVVEVPVTYTPVDEVEEGVVVNKDTLSYKLLSLFDTLEDTIWDKEMDNAKRGEICRESIESLRVAARELSKVA